MRSQVAGRLRRWRCPRMLSVDSERADPTAKTRKRKRKRATIRPTPRRHERNVAHAIVGPQVGGRSKRSSAAAMTGACHANPQARRAADTGVNRLPARSSLHQPATRM